MNHIFVVVSLLSTFLLASPLQDAIDNAVEGSIIRLDPGVYQGNIVITKPITIEMAPMILIIAFPVDRTSGSVKSGKIEMLALR